MKIENIKKLLANFHDKAEYIIHVKSLNQVFNHESFLKKVNRVIKFN